MHPPVGARRHLSPAVRVLPDHEATPCSVQTRICSRPLIQPPTGTGTWSTLYLKPYQMSTMNRRNVDQTPSYLHSSLSHPHSFPCSVYLSWRRLPSPQPRPSSRSFCDGAAIEDVASQASENTVYMVCNHTHPRQVRFCLVVYINTLSTKLQVAFRPPLATSFVHVMSVLETTHSSGLSIKFLPWGKLPH